MYALTSRHFFIFFPFAFRVLLGLAVAGALLCVLAQPGQAQGKGLDKLGVVKVKSEGSVRKKQKKASKFVGNSVPVSNPKKSRPGNMADAKAYEYVGLPPRSRNPMGEQIARRSTAYKGNGRVESAYKKEKRARKNNRKISQYRGDLLVKKLPKGSHPSAAYRGGKVKNSYQQKERYRKRMMKRIGRNRNLQQPNYLKERKKKFDKPTYDSRESEIWNKPR